MGSDINQKIVINITAPETRIAVVEDGRLAEIHIERCARRGLVGNIYKARVSRVVPGIQSAFINIGVDRSAFLFAGDVIDPEYINELSQDKDSRALDEMEVRRTINKKPIQKLIRSGEEIIVQVSKEALGSKGPRVTTLVTISGRYLVLMPAIDMIGVSRRIASEEERARLRSEVERCKPDGLGVIVRTAAEGVSSEVLEKDLNYLRGEWQYVQEKGRVSPPQTLIYQGPDIVTKTIRDLYNPGVKEILIDDHHTYSHLRHFLADSIPEAADKINLYEGIAPIFDLQGVEPALQASLARKVPLISGGHMVIDQTEALTAFDVNTGKFTGSGDARQTILTTNLEAAEEVASQLRKRNIGGIVVIDFIDMTNAGDQLLVKEAFEKALSHDKAKTNVLAFSDLGLVQMTRKRTAESLKGTLMEPCPHCEGSGAVKSLATLAYELARGLSRFVAQTESKVVNITLRSDLKVFIDDHESRLFEQVAQKLGIQLNWTTAEFDRGVLAKAPFEIRS